jgi:PIN domain nuclease of toxin-antitoxin system
MNYLLDTHAFIWTLLQKERLSDYVQEVIEDPDNEIIVSAISFWEISLKYALGKLDIKGFSPEDLPGFAAQSGFTTLPLLAAESASDPQQGSIRRDVNMASGKTGYHLN